jgi:large subunit ribosomal protein L9
MLDRPIKMLGLHNVRIGLHAEVEPHVTINVARSPDEAARQARGEQVTGKAMDEAEEEAFRAKAAAEKLFGAGAGGELVEGAEETAEDKAESTD